jgi:hypothetical protein
MNNQNKSDINSLIADIADIAIEIDNKPEGELFDIVQNLIKLGRADSLDGNNSSQKQRVEKIITMLEKKDLSSET